MTWKFEAQLVVELSVQTLEALASVKRKEKDQGKRISLEYSISSNLKIMVPLIMLHIDQLAWYYVLY